MNNIIQILPDSVANQIAAGEVVQRPASVVKELMENSIDADATQIQVTVKQAGKYLIQIADNGKGMSEVDARLAFERHATSKITKVDDLFALHTFGFRGEALASIAAIAEVEVKTRPESSEMGTHLLIRGSAVEQQQPIACPKGTSIAVRNLFYNVPARRRFLKTDAVEYRSIETELRRVALCHPETAVKFYNDDKLVCDLPVGNFKNRILKMFDNHAALKKGLLELHNSTDIVDIQGFASTPEAASSVRDKQYLFVNGRYFHSAYFRSAIVRAYEGLLPNGTEPAFFVYFKVKTDRLDVNIHPSKTEIKFNDEQIIWQLLHSAVKAALGQYMVIPSINFDAAKVIDINIPLPSVGGVLPAVPNIDVNPAYNPFTAQIDRDYQQYRRSDWRGTLQMPNENHPFLQQDSGMRIASRMNFENDVEISAPQHFLQIGRKFILTHTAQGLLVIHQGRAHRRILYEQFLRTLQNGGVPQTALFPEKIVLSDSDCQLLLSLSDDLRNLGFVVSGAEGGLCVEAIPAFVQGKDAAGIVDDLLAMLHKNEQSPQENQQQMLTAHLACAAAIHTGKALLEAEMADLHARLFACAEPHICPQGKTVFKNMSTENLGKWLNR